MVPESCLDTAPGIKDYFFGKETAFDSGVDKINWESKIPEFEIQYQRKKKGSLNSVFDTSSCVTFSVLSAIESFFEHIKNKIPKEDLLSLEKAGFIDDGKLNLSDRDIASRSGTQESIGNNFAKVLETIRVEGVIPEKDHPFDTSIKSWSEYMVDGPQLQEKRDLFKRIFDIKWEWLFWAGDGLSHDEKINRIDLALKDSAVCVSSPICSGWSRFKPANVIEWCNEKKGGHATMHLSNKQKRLDTYEPFVKTLKPDYWIQHAVRVALILNKKKEPIKYELPLLPVSYGQTTDDVRRLQSCLEFLGYQKVTSNPLRPYYGDRTAEAVLSFQLAEKVDSERELKRLGGRFVGNKTLSALKKRLG